MQPPGDVSQKMDYTTNDRRENRFVSHLSYEAAAFRVHKRVLTFKDNCKNFLIQMGRKFK